jgi:hypothetical protein
MYYRSTKALGRLFRAIEIEPLVEEEEQSDPQDFDPNVLPFAEETALEDDILGWLRPRLGTVELAAQPETLQLIQDVLIGHSIELKRIAFDYSLPGRGEPLTEAEVVANVVLAPTAIHKQRVDAMDNLRQHYEALLKHTVARLRAVDAPAYFTAFKVAQTAVLNREYGANSFVFICQWLEHLSNLTE